MISRLCPSLAQALPFAVACIGPQACFYNPTESPKATESTTLTSEAGTPPTGEMSTPPTGDTSPPPTGEVGTTPTNDMSTTSLGTVDTTATGEAPLTSTGEALTTSTGEPLPDVATLKLSFSQVKQFNFSWDAAGGASYYQLLERPSIDVAYENLGGDIVGESISVTMPLHFRLGASYILRGCNDGGCTESEAIEVADSLNTAVGYFKASNTGQGDYFGYDVAFSADGNTLAVSAPFESSAATGINGNASDNTAPSAGAVYIFIRTNNAWSLQAYIKASNTGIGDNFGSGVALSSDGNTLAVGATLEDSSATGIDGNQALNGALDSGALYVFTRTNNAWSQQAYIKASNTDKLDTFGCSPNLSADGNTLVVGAFAEDSAATGIGGSQADNSASSAGAAYVFLRANDTWSQQAYIKGSNTGADDYFGLHIALSADGNTLAAGARNEDSASTGINGKQNDNTAANSGAVYVFQRTEGAWSQQAYLKASNTGPGDFFGFGLALSADGNTLAAGAFAEDGGATVINGNQDDNNANSAGAAYVFSREGNSWSQQAYVKASNTGANDWFGYSLGVSADGNILAVGASNEGSASSGIDGNQADNSAKNAGAVYVFLRANSAWSQQTYVKASNPSAGDLFGYSLGLSGDGNSLAVGARGESSAATGIGGDQAGKGALESGAAYMF